ncbi:MAG: hypothetical protein U0840_08395 [Gemmataceae bacterium]
MLHVSCDGCGKELGHGDKHHIVRIEVYMAADPTELTEADLDQDHLEAVAEVLREIDASGETPAELEAPSQRLRYDLCSSCRTRYLRDPLGKEAAPKLHFSQN